MGDEKQSNPVNGRFQWLRDDLERIEESINERLDHIQEQIIARLNDHEERMQALEAERNQRMGAAEERGRVTKGRRWAVGVVISIFTVAGTVAGFLLGKGGA